MVNKTDTFEVLKGDGVATTWTLTKLEYLSNGENIKITRYDPNESGAVAERVLTYGTDYTIDPITNIVETLQDPDNFNIPYSSDTILTVTTNLDFTQKTDITSNSNYDPEVLETAYDKNVLLAKQNKEVLDRTIKLSQTDVDTDLTLPPLGEVNAGYLFIESDGASEPSYSLNANIGPVPKTWDPLYPYSAGNITQYDGKMWICNWDDTGTQPGSETPASTWNIYTDRVGNWNIDIDYSADDIVYYNGDLWIAVEPIVGDYPQIGADPTSPKWTIYVDRTNTYSPYIPYEINDIVSYSTVGYDGTFVRCIQDNIGHAPLLTPGATDSYWEVVKTGGSVEVNGEVGSVALAALKLVYFDSTGKLSLGDNRYTEKAFLAGITQIAGNIGETVIVQSGGLLTGFPATTFVPGTTYVLGHDGTFITRGSVDYSELIVPVGTAVDDTTLDVRISFPEPTRNQDNGIPIGDYTESGTSRDRTAEGLYAVDFDNALSQANYPILFDQIGHKWNDAHVAVGDVSVSDNVAGLFYPTPPPSYYSRVGIPDIEFTDADVLGSPGFLYINNTGLPSTIRSGTPFIYSVVSGTGSVDLTDGDTYFILNSAGTMYLATSEANAIAGIKIAYTDSGSGTFLLTQEGIVLDDAFQGHIHSVVLDSAPVSTLQMSNTSGSDTTSLTPGAGPYSGSIRAQTISTDNLNGTPRTSNETRPKTMMMFKYVKAEYVTTAGEPISALRYDTGWIANSVWTNADLPITHNLNTALSDLIVNILISFTGNDDDSIKIESSNYTDSGGTLELGISMISISDNAFKLQTGSSGVGYVRDSDGAIPVLGASTAAYYKVVITKPNLVATIFDTVEMPRKYDISTTNKTVTLPLLTGVNQKRTYKWTGGDGTAKLQFFVPDKDDVYSTSVYEGEGEGIITFEATNTDSGLAWEVTKYEDRMLSTNQIVWKYKDKTEKQIILNTFTDTIDNATGSLFRSIEQGGITRVHPLITLVSSSISLVNLATNTLVWLSSSANSASITDTGSYYLIDSGSQSTPYAYTVSSTAIGTWA